MLRSMLLGLGLVVAAQVAHAEEPPVPAPGFEMKLGIPKTWTAAKAKRGAVDVTIYTISSVKDAVFVVYPPSNAYGTTIPKAIAGFMSKVLGKQVVSRYPRVPRVRVTWYGIKHARQHAMVRAKKGYGMRVVYAFDVKGSMQIAVAEAKSSRLIKPLLIALSPVIMSGSATPRKPHK